MSLYKTRPFSRLAKKAGISDSALKAVVEEMRAGIIHAGLGGNVYKQRVAVEGRGKRSGNRVIVVANLQDRWIFVHCYSKNDKSNISHHEEIAFKEFAHIYLNLSEKTIQAAVGRGILEVLYDDETQK
jgi:hypothetical protein